MLARNGTSRLLAANPRVGNGKSVAAAGAGGFFKLFWRWSTLMHSTGHSSTKGFHSLSPSPRPAVAILRQRVLGTQRRYESSTTSAAAQLEGEKEVGEGEGVVKEESELSTRVRRIMRGLPHSVVVLTTSIFYPLPNPSPAPSPESAYSTGAALTEETSTEAFPTEAASSELSSQSPQSALSPEIEDDNTHREDWRGMTLSSFTTLSLGTKPTIIFNICKPSLTLNALSQSKTCLIHILAANDEGAKIAERFTRGGGGKTGFDECEVTGIKGMKIKYAKGFKGLCEHKAILPRLGGKGVLQVLKCRIPGGNGIEGAGKKLRGLTLVGDHVLVIGEVLEVLEGEGDEKLGLCYADGKYRAIGDVIDVPGKTT